MKEFALMMIGAALVNNVILARFLGLCSFMGVTTRIDTAAGMGLATTFVITVSSMADWAVQHYLLDAYGLGFLRTVTFILVIASAGAIHRADHQESFAQPVPDAGHLPAADHHQLRRARRRPAAGRGPHELPRATLFGFASSVGYSLVMVIFAGLRERLALAQVPRLFAGPPIGFIVASLLAMAFMGFSGISTG
jgi:electron transport complex protein RnfA